jgi:magnesium and cobalt transporter
MEDHSDKTEVQKTRHQNNTKPHLASASRVSNSKYLSKKQHLCNKFSEIWAIIFKQKHKASLLKLIGELVECAEIQEFIASDAQKMIRNIINISDVKVDDVMIPRTDIIAVSKSATLDEIREVIMIKEHTRIPVYSENLDEIIGFIHSKDLVKFLGSKHHNFKINDIIRKVLYVPHVMRITDLLLKMRSSQVHIAIVLDEYGGTDGLVTIENIMEEIVGEIEDEHDLPDDNIYMTINKISDKLLQVGGRIEIEEIEELLAQKIIEDKEGIDFDTVGGLILATLKKVPEIGEVFKHSSGLTFKVLDADMRSVKLVEISQESSPKNEVVN